MPFIQLNICYYIRMIKVKKQFIFFVWMVVFAGSILYLPAGEKFILDDFSYASNQQAQAVWVAGSGYPAVQTGIDEGEHYLQTPIDYHLHQDRHWWDGYLSLDLSAYDRIVLDVEIPNLGIMQYFTLYFHCATTNSWGGSSAGIYQTGRQLWTFEKDGFSLPSDDFDWSNINRVRFSPWKNQEGTSYLRFYNFYAYSPDIYIVEGTQSVFYSTAEDIAQQIFTIFNSWDISVGLITDIDVENGKLEGAQLAIYPYNDNVSEQELDELEDFVQAGGKLMVFYNLPGRTADLLGLNNQGWIQEQYDGQFASYLFDTEDIAGLPEQVIQDSWNIRHVIPKRADSRVIAWWKNAGGDILDYPAWLLSDTGAYKSHIILRDDLVNTEKALLAITGQLHPRTWIEISEGAYDNIGRIAYYQGYSEAVSDIEVTAVHSPRKSEVYDYLEQAEILRNATTSLFEDEQYIEAYNMALEAREALLQAYYHVHRGRPGEFRAMWEHAGTGIKPGDWEYSIQVLKEAGFNSVIPNFLWGGTAHYESDYLHPTQAFLDYGDQVAQAVEAAHNAGMTVHAWKVHWRIHHAPESWQQQMSNAGRLQKSVHGEESSWLCPSHPDNQALELNSMLELVHNYDIDGLHMDYIRYQNDEYCYCDGCRDRFEEFISESIINWPDDCYSGHHKETYTDWRISNITRLVRSVSEEARAIEPGILISAAVFANYDTDLNLYAQEWVEWCKAGYLDFVCPMNYTTNFNRFERLLERQIELLEESIPMYPGIGAYVLTADEVIAQIKSAREYNLPGFVLFNYDPNAAENILPYLGKGITKDPKTAVRGFSLFE